MEVDNSSGYTGSRDILDQAYEIPMGTAPLQLGEGILQLPDSPVILEKEETTAEGKIQKRRKRKYANWMDLNTDLPNNELFSGSNLLLEEAI